MSACVVPAAIAAHACRSCVSRSSRDSDLAPSSAVRIGCCNGTPRVSRSASSATWFLVGVASRAGRAAMRCREARNVSPVPVGSQPSGRAFRDTAQVREGAGRDGFRVECWRVVRRGPPVVSGGLALLLDAYMPAPADSSLAEYARLVADEIRAGRGVPLVDGVRRGRGTISRDELSVRSGVLSATIRWLENARTLEPDDRFLAALYDHLPHASPTATPCLALARARWTLDPRAPGGVPAAKRALMRVRDDLLPGEKKG